MNHAPSSGSSSPQAGPSTRHETSTAATATAAATTDGSESSRSQQNASTHKAQKLVFLDHLIRHFDIVVFCQLSILYYMDCSLSKFLLRALPHWFLFSPKPERLLPPSATHPNNGPYLGTIVTTNLICILLHAFFAPPAASEAARGYLHGGMIIDFVGQASPVGRWRLVAYDLACLGLQIVMMALTVEKMALHGARSVRSGDGVPLSGRQAQDLDAEERGVLGAEERGEAGTEMQDLGRHRAGRTGGEEDAERDELLAWEMEGVHPLDQFYAGDYMLARLHLLETLRAESSRRPATTTTTTTMTTTTTDTSRRFAIGTFFPNLFSVSWRRIEDRG